MSYFRKERFSMKQLVIMLSVAMILCAVYASAVTLNTFTTGTTISASAVNTNFQNLNNALPLLWASTDTVGGGVFLTNVGMTTVNTVSITAPSAGFLIITGSCFVNNNGPAVQIGLKPMLDGADISGSLFEALAFFDADLAPTEQLTLTYNKTIPITAGAHTVTQQVGPFTAATTSFFYNKNNLTVVFMASSQGSLVTVSAPERASPSRESQTGE